MKTLKRFSVVCDPPAAKPFAPFMPEGDVMRFNRANALATEGRHEEAVVKFRELSGSIATFPWLPLNLGASLVALGRWEEALGAFEWATRTVPNDPLSHGNMGAALGYLGRSSEALPYLCRAIELSPSDLGMQLNLVRALHALRHPDLIKVAQIATRLAPESAEAHLCFGNALLLFNAHKDAVKAYREAARLEPGCLDHSSNFGLALFGVGAHQEALDFFERTIERRPGDADAWAGAALAQLHGGNLPESIRAFRRSVELNPENALVHSNLLIALCYSPDHTSPELLAEARAWAAHHTPEGRELPDRLPRNREKLRIGYLSADFHAHPAGYLYEAMFPFHDRSRFELFAYSTKEHYDEVTDRIKASVDCWVDVEFADDDTLAARIREDEIDILIDLLGHTPNHRLKAMGRHPAPIQASWLGYFGTTGMSQMDYIIADRYVLPEEHEGFYCEQPARMAGCLYVFQPPNLEVPPNALPALTNGYVTFGCFNHLAKINPEVIALWAEVLRAVPDSRMVLNRWPLDSAEVQKKYAALFAENGVDPSRVEFHATEGRGNYFKTYHQVDIMLDTSPFCGGTTTSEALWMGVPVVSLMADRFPGRMAESILRTVGLPDLIPADRAGYVRLARELAADLPRLAGLRETLRERVERSPLCDVESYTRDLETTFEWMWEEKFGARSE